MPVVIVATIVPIAEHRDAVMAAVQAAAAQVHDEPGCELYALHEAPDRLVLVEKWASPEALSAHRGGAALATLGGALRGKVAAAPDVVVLRPAPAGDAAKGQL